MLFAKLPQLVERSGNGVAGGGSITAFYTVLSEGDDPQDPIADAARGILDGHIVLSRELAEAGHYPAIDIEASISRAMTSLIGPDESGRAALQGVCTRATSAIATSSPSGVYAPGSDTMLDRAIALYPAMEAFLQQNISEKAVYVESLARLRALLGPAAEQ